METIIAPEFIITIGITAIIITLLGLLVLIAISGLRRRIKQSHDQVKEISNQIQSLRQELHAMKTQGRIRPSPAEPPITEGKKIVMQHPAWISSTDDTLKISRP